NCCIYNLSGQKKLLGACRLFLPLALRPSSLGRRDVARPPHVVSGTMVVSIRGQIGRLLTSSSSSWAESALTINISLIAPTAGPPASIFFSSNNVSHASRLGRMSCSVNAIPSSAPPLGRLLAASLISTRYCIFSSYLLFRLLCGRSVYVVHS